MEIEDVKQIIQEALVESEKRTQQNIQNAVTEAKEETQRYIGALKESFDDKFEVVMEALQPLGTLAERVTNVEEIVADMQPKVDATFEKVGEIAEDIESSKETVQNHEQRLQKVEIGD